jgi:hypothetical protein
MADSIAARPAPHRAGWLLVGLLLLVQFALFRQMVLREIAPTLPYAYDQTSYLALAYDTYETMLDRGPAAGLTEGLAQPVPAGCLMHVQAAVTFLLLGPSRFAALLPHFLYYAGFQVVLAAVLLRWTRRWEAAYFGLGLLLCAGTTLHWQGGLLDFRIDGIAYSLYGIVLGACLLSDGFACRRWSLAVAAAACLLFLFRHLTVVYFGGIMAFWLAFMLGRLLWLPCDRLATWRRLGNAALAAAIFLAAAVPVIALRWKLLWGYYGVGHLTGEEKHIRAAELGVFSAADSLLFYVRSVWDLHAGWLFFAVGGLGVALSVILWRRKTAFTASPAAWVLAALGLVVPWLVLTANTSKSPLVGNVLAAALLWLFLLPLARSAGAWPAWLLRGAVAAALTAGLATQFTGYCQREPRFANAEEDRRQLLALHDDLAEHARRQGWATVIVSSNTMSDCAPPHTLGVPAYERQHVRLNVKVALSGSIFGSDEAAGQADVRKSHFVVLRDGDSLTCPAFPAAQSLARLTPWLREYCRTHMQEVGTYSALGGRFTLYAVPWLRPTPDGREWVTSAGLRLEGQAGTLRQFPRIRLSGKAARIHLPKHPNAEVAVSPAGGNTWTIPAAVTFPKDDHYLVDFEIPAGRLPADDVAVRLSVRFDTHFVPQQLGMNDDVRELVVFGPDQIELHRHEDVGMTGNLEKPHPADGE